MRNFLTRAAAGFVLSAMLAGSAALAQQELTERDGVWAQTYSDIKADPAVRFGQLPNGMRYAIMHNQTPAHEVSLRFVIRAGSLDETDAQQGLAHFLEHMAFKGSAKVGADEMIPTLQRLGLSFGADTNASTSWDQTLYLFDLPNADAATLDTGLTMMRETASHLLLSDKAFEPERGVILSEERLRDTPGYRSSKSELGFVFAGQRVPARFPIGQVPVIQNAPVKELRDFYEAHYRPELAALIVVGDVDAAAVETQIREKFSDWKSTTPVPAPPDLGMVQTRGPQTRLAVVPGAPLDIELDWVRPYDNSADMVATRKTDIVRSLAYAVLNRRLDLLARAPNPPFLSASVSRANWLKSADIYSLSISAAPADWQKALIAADTMRRQILASGITQAELDREVREARTEYQNAVARTATRRTPQLAGALLSAASNNSVFSTPADNSALFEDAVKGLTAAQADALLKDAFRGSGPLVFMATPVPVKGGEKALADSFATAEAAPLTAYAVNADKKWTYADSFGATGTVTEQKEIADIGVTFARFANGVRLTVKPTTFTNDQVLVSVRIGHGLLSLPSRTAIPGWTVSAFVAGGLKDLTFPDISDLFSEKMVSIDAGMGEDAFELNGQTRPADLDTQMQLLAAYATAPGYRAEALDRTRTGFRTRLERLDSTPEGALSRDFEYLTHDKDMRWRTPAPDALAAANIDSLKAIVAAPLASGPVEIVMVGDITVEAAEKAVAATFGALPRRDASPAPAAGLAVKFPAATAAPIRLTHKGRADQAIAVLAWPTDDFIAGQQRARAVRLAEQILQNRLIEQFRIAEGNTYSPQTEFVASQVFPHYGYVAAEVETLPGKVDTFFTETARIAADMREHGVSDDDMQRARAPRIEALQRSQQLNAYWLSALGGAQTEAGRLEAIRDVITGMQKVTKEDVQKAAQDYFRDDTAFKIEVMPATGAAAP